MGSDRRQRRAVLRSCVASFIGLLMACTEGTPPPPAGSDEVSQRVRAVLAIQDDLERVGQLVDLLQTLPAEAAPAVAEGYENSFVDRGDIELVLLTQWWVPHDAEAATRWATTNWRAEHPRVEYAAMRAIARLDPERALRLYYARKQDPRAYAASLQAVIVGWYESDKPGLFEFINTQPSEDLRQQTMGTLARIKVLDVGPEEATAWAEETARARGNDRFSDQLMLRVANATAEVKPEIAAAWAEQMIAQGASTKLLIRVASRWSKRDGLAALAWLSGFEETPDQQHAVRRSFNNFHLGNLLVAEPWLLGQGDATFTWLAPALESFLKTKTDRWYANPATRADVPWTRHLDLAIGIQEEARRWGTVAHIARLWLLVDAAAAEAWMEEHEVPQLYREKARGPLPAGYQRQLLERAKR